MHGAICKERDLTNASDKKIKSDAKATGWNLGSTQETVRNYWGHDMSIDCVSRSSTLSNIQAYIQNNARYNLRNCSVLPPGIQKSGTSLFEYLVTDQGINPCQGQAF